MASKRKQREARAAREAKAAKRATRELRDARTDLRSITDEMVRQLAEATIALRAAAVAPGAPVPAEVEQSTTDIERRLERLMVMQARTNELLELGLGVAFDAEIDSPRPR